MDNRHLYLGHPYLIGDCIYFTWLGNLFSNAIDNANTNALNYDQNQILYDEIGNKMKMMEISREFQANQRALTVLNDTLQKTVNEIGRN